MLRRSSILVFVISLFASRSSAAEIGAEGDLLSVDVHAFASQGFILATNHNNYPFGLYNEINDIDAARAAILLPQSVYPAQNRDFPLVKYDGAVGYVSGTATTNGCAALTVRRVRRCT
jgi:hypothetical protein